MKKFLGLLALFILALSSCTNELPEWKEPAPTDTIPITRTPDFLAYSGENILGVSTRSSENQHLSSKERHEWPANYAANAPELVTEDEWNYVKQYLVEHPNEGGLVCDLTDYFIQLAGKSEAVYTTTDRNNASHSIVGSNQMDYIEIDGVHLNDYNGSAGPLTLCQDWPLIDPTYKDSYGTGDVVRHNMYRFYYIEYNGKVGLYLCFDYTTSKDSGEYVPGDGIFNDWVLKISPADGSEVKEPGNEDKDEPTLPKEEQEGFDEVEINLSADSDLIAHLSIHVRAVTDVDVFIPIPAEYYCEVDDMAIVQKHYDELMIHGGPESVEYNINGTVVTMNVEFKEDGIRVWTEGIDENVIDYCYNTYGDGITFEVWNYLNGTLDRSGLLNLLNQSTVTFTDPPSKYVNAFNKTSEGDKFEWDATVSPVQSGYNPPEQGLHYNGSPYNQIYTRK